MNSQIKTRKRRASKRIRTACYQCLETIFVSNDGYATGHHACPLCDCYMDGTATPEEALAALPEAMNVSKKKATKVAADYLKYQTKIEYPNGYVAKD